MNENKLSPEVREHLLKCKTKEEAEAVLKANNIDLSLDEIDRSSLSDIAKGELPEEDMEKVSGGTIYGYLFGGCWPWDHNYVPTGAKMTNNYIENGKYVVEILYEKYQCTKCGDVDWR